MQYLSLPITAILLLTLTGISSNAQTTHQLTIRRHSTVTFSDTQADTFLSVATNALKTDDDGTPGVQDRACDVTLSRSGNIGLLARAPASINSEADFDAVSTESSFVKVVELIAWCGGTVGGSFSGCSNPRSRNMVVSRSLANELTWAHEFGHTTGLPDTRVPKAIMYFQSSNDKRYVNDTECNSGSSWNRVGEFRV
jgi:hypothetical protein